MYEECVFLALPPDYFEQRGRHCDSSLARGVPGTRLLVGSRFAGDKCVCWWEVVLLVKRRFAGEKCVCW